MEGRSNFFFASEHLNSSSWLMRRLSASSEFSVEIVFFLFTLFSMPQVIFKYYMCIFVSFSCIDGIILASLLESSS